MATQQEMQMMSLMKSQGILDPYGMQGGEFQQPQRPQMPQMQQQSMQQQLDPQRMAYGAALMNMGDIMGGRAPSTNIASTYMQAKMSNDKMRQNKAARSRQVEQDDLNRRKIESQIAKNMGVGASGGKIGTVNPRDFTADSIASYQETGDIKELKRYRPKVVDIGGIDHTWDEETQAYKPVVDLTSPDYVAQIDASVKLEQKKQSALDFTKEQSKWRAKEVSFINSIGNSEQKQTVMQDTANEIKSLIGGWSSEWGTALKNIPGSEARKLAGLLDTIRANSAFTTLIDLKAGGGTLGAISEAELNLLERAWGALDQGGDSQELLRVLDQILGQNTGSLQRLRYGYEENSKRYGTDLVNDASLPVVSEKLSDDDLLNKWLK